MTTTIEIDREVYQVLEESFGKKALKESISEILISALESKLEKYSRGILLFEAKYGISFDEFATMWSNNKIAEPFSYEVESDYVDWEMLEMEKKDLIAAVSRIKKALSR